MLTFRNSAFVNRDYTLLTKMQDPAHPHRSLLAGKTTARTKLVMNLVKRLSTQEVPHDRQGV